MSEPEVQAWAPMEVVESLLARAEKAEVAIQRVRDVCADKYVGPPTEYGEGFQNGYNDALAQVLHALNGDSDE